MFQNNTCQDESEPIASIALPSVCTAILAAYEEPGFNNNFGNEFADDNILVKPSATFFLH